jgi:hypothetical protein
LKHYRLEHNTEFEELRLTENFERALFAPSCNNFRTRKDFRMRSDTVLKNWRFLPLGRRNPQQI